MKREKKVTPWLASLTGACFLPSLCLQSSSWEVIPHGKKVSDFTASKFCFPFLVNLHKGSFAWGSACRMAFDCRQRNACKINDSALFQTRSWKQLHQFAGKMMLLSYSGERVETVEVVPHSFAQHYACWGLRSRTEVHFFSWILPLSLLPWGSFTTQQRGGNSQHSLSGCS